MSYFSDGVTRDKLMVLYFLNALSIELTREQITTFSGEKELIGYFDLQRAVYELEEEGMLAAVPRPIGQSYCLTPKGKEALAMFEERLPLSLRTELDEHADARRETLRLQSQYSGSVERAQSNSRRVTLRAMERDGELLEIRLLLPDSVSAKQAIDAWPSHSERIYKYLLQELLQENDQ